MLYHEMYETAADHILCFFGGYSDEIDESANNLTDKGILGENKNGYYLTEYGCILRRYIIDEYEDEEQIRRIGKIKNATSQLPDRNLVGLTYHFYGETAVNSRIEDSVRRFNMTALYDGVPLMDYNKTDFELKLRSGTPIRRRVDRF